MITAVLVMQMPLFNYSTHVVWAQTNEQIAYAVGPDGAHQIYLMNSDGSDSRVLTTHGDNTEPNWSSDRHTIAFGSTNNGATEVHVINADGSGEHQLTNGGGYSPNWAPSNQRLAFISDRTGIPQLFITDSSGNNIQQLTSDPNAEASAPAWAPNNQVIAFVYSKGGQSAIWLINVDGGSLHQFTNDQDGNDYGAAWAPDGQHLAYAVTTNGDSDIRIVDTNGSNGTQVASLPGKYADSVSWSPDGKQLVFSAWASKKPKAIFVVASDGVGSFRQLTGSTSGDGAGWPSWASNMVSSANPLNSPSSPPTSSGVGAGNAIASICQNSPLSRLSVGMTAQVTPGNPNHVRDVPAGNVLFVIPGGQNFRIIGGPRCDQANQFTWWQVEYNGQQGWTPEGQGNIYWLQPSNLSNAETNSGGVGKVCQNSPSSRLAVGMTGQVTPGDPNNVRDVPGGNVFFKIPGGQTFRIIGGPKCDQSYQLTWWQVEYKGQSGWTPEGQGNIYWLQPVQ
jgi:Tol biopolymer transport system component